MIVEPNENDFQVIAPFKYFHGFLLLKSVQKKGLREKALPLMQPQEARLAERA